LIILAFVISFFSVGMNSLVYLKMYFTWQLLLYAISLPTACLFLNLVQLRWESHCQGQRELQWEQSEMRPISSVALHYVPLKERPKAYYTWWHIRQQWDKCNTTKQTGHQTIRWKPGSQAVVFFFMSVRGVLPLCQTKCHSWQRKEQERAQC
jgi:hypothetical protein